METMDLIADGATSPSATGTTPHSTRSTPAFPVNNNIATLSLSSEGFAFGQVDSQSTRLRRSISHSAHSNSPSPPRRPSLQNRSSSTASSSPWDSNSTSSYQTPAEGHSDNDASTQVPQYASFSRPAPLSKINNSPDHVLRTAPPRPSYPPPAIPNRSSLCLSQSTSMSTPNLSQNGSESTRCSSRTSISILSPDLYSGGDSSGEENTHSYAKGEIGLGLGIGMEAVIDVDDEEKTLVLDRPASHSASIVATPFSSEPDEAKPLGHPFSTPFPSFSAARPNSTRGLFVPPPPLLPINSSNSVSPFAPTPSLFLAEPVSVSPVPSAGPSLSTPARKTPLDSQVVDGESYLSVDESGLETEDDSRDDDSESVPRMGKQASATSSCFGLENGWEANEENEDDERQDMLGEAGGMTDAWKSNSGVVDKTGLILASEDVTKATTHLIAPRVLNHHFVPMFFDIVMPTLAAQLVVLDISSNHLSEIPSAISLCSSLQELDIKANTLTSGDLPSFLNALPTLRVLIADNCGLTEIRHSFGSLTNLHTLSLRHNQLVTLPPFLARLSALQLLLLDDNPWHWHWQNVLRPLLFGTVPKATKASDLATKSSISLQSVGEEVEVEARASLRPVESTTASLPNSPSLSPAWGKKLFVRKKKDSLPSSPVISKPETKRSVSAPIAGEVAPLEALKASSARRLFGRRFTGRSSSAPDHSNRRRSFLPILNSAPPELPASPSQPVFDHSASLRSLIAYLRDLDDLAPEPSAPPLPLPTPFVAPLRNSPSLGNIAQKREEGAAASASVRRVKSSRYAPERGDSEVTGAQSIFDSSAQEAEDHGSSETSLSSKVVLDPIKRGKVLKEIIASEESYLRGLEELCDLYIAPASEIKTGKKDSVIPFTERRLVFGNVEDIRDFHSRVFLPDLVMALKNRPLESAAPDVARVFIRHAAFLKIYAGYITSFDSAVARFEGWTTERRSSASSLSPPSPSLDSIPFTLSPSQRKRIKDYLKRAKSDPRHSQISLPAYLLLPIQRLPRYRLLLESLLSCTPSTDDPDALTPQPHPVVQEALDIIAGVATDLNERKRENEGRQQLLIWQNRIGNRFRSPLVQPHRSLIRSGKITLTRVVKRGTFQIETPGDPLEILSLQTETTPRTLICLLCTDIIVFANEPLDPSDPNGPVELFTVLRLAQSISTLVPASLFGNDGLLRITFAGKAILYVQCASLSDATKWMHAINLQHALNI